MNKTELIDAMAADAGITKAAAKKALESFLGNVEGSLKKGNRVYLDLGSVNVMAGITVNGKTLHTLWMPPFKADITDLLKKGNNKLNLEITSTSPCKSPGLIGPVRLDTSVRKELF